MKEKVFSKINIPLFLMMIIYSLFGLLMIFSASSAAAVLRYQVSSSYFFIRQIIFVVLGFVLGFVILKVPTKNYRFFSKLAMFGILILLSGLFIAGKVAGGALSWYDIGFFNFQPTELSKIILIVYLAVYYHRISSKKKISLFNMIYPLLLAGGVFGLIAIQPDFGGAFIIFVITFLVFFSLPIGKKHKKKIFKIGIGGVILLLFMVFVFGKNILQGYQMSRLLNFTNPCQRYSDDTGYQVCNGYIAIHNGGLSGVGLGNSTQKYMYLPEAHTDFIFAIICEELGLLVGVAVVVGYFVMMFMILSIAKQTSNIRDSILAYGTFAYLLSHILINLLGILGLIPLTGVPLPFLSYGGSYNLCVLISLFIVQRVNVENKNSVIRKKIENL